MTEISIVRGVTAFQEFRYPKRTDVPQGQSKIGQPTQIGCINASLIAKLEMRMMIFFSPRAARNGAD